MPRKRPFQQTRPLLWLSLLCCAVTGCHRPAVVWKPIHWPTLPRTQAIPDTLPLGSVARAHFHTMQANAEASDFIFHRHEFVDYTAELTPYGRDHLLEVAARARSTPFPILIERSEHNANPELDEHRRRIISQILADFGIAEAEQRTIVAPAYGRGLNSLEGEFDYQNFISTRGTGQFGQFGQFGNQFGQFGGFGAGGGIGFGP